LRPFSDDRNPVFVFSDRAMIVRRSPGEGGPPIARSELWLASHTKVGPAIR
jgi:hypothetical protein